MQANLRRLQSGGKRNSAPALDKKQIAKIKAKKRESLRMYLKIASFGVLFSLATIASGLKRLKSVSVCVRVVSFALSLFRLLCLGLHR